MLTLDQLKRIENVLANNVSFLVKRKKRLITSSGIAQR